MNNPQADMGKSPNILGERGSQLYRLAEEFVERSRRGEQPLWTEYAERNIELADDIRQLFPTLLLLEHFTAAQASEPLVASCNESKLPSIAGFRILREIGSGGMGRVYEAEELALRRRVAVKVLPTHDLDIHWRTERFQREAKVAATLHHTNIVPVFGASEDHGRYFYVMQYIDGIGLDKILPLRSTPGEPSATASENHRIEIDNLKERQALLEKLVGTVESIARIGYQVAEALQYAHSQGVVHRDIKPSNLLLDQDGKVWITDFGLAKADSQQSMTQTGDLLGTLQYMAPERFRGTNDVRGDVYGLGMTLYELLAQRPAFAGSSREELIYRILYSSVTPLRDLNPDVPRDLSVIVHKAIDPIAERRYASAGELAADLQRFLSSEPIHARRVSTTRRIWYWGRRNPAAAALLVVLTLIGISSPFLVAYFAQLARHAQLAERQVQLKLYESLRTTAKAKRFSQRPGHNFDAIAALFAAQNLHRELALPKSEIDDLRMDAIASMALVDLQPEIQWPTTMFGNLSLAHFNDDLSLYCAPVTDGINICRTADNKVLSSLPISQNLSKARFSPDGKLICITAWESDGGTVDVWNWRTAELVYSVASKATMFASDFSPDGNLLAVGHLEGTVSIHDLRSQSLVNEFSVASAPFNVAFSPDGQRLAVSVETEYCAEIWDFQTPQLLRRLDHPSDTYGLAWSHDGRIVAVVEGNDIYLWDTLSTEPVPWRVLRGHNWVVSEILFHPNGRLLFSHSWREEKTRVWDLATGKEKLICQGFPSRVTADGKRMAFRTTDSVGIWQLAPGDLHFSLTPIDRIERQFVYCDFDRKGRWLATASDQGLDLWETKSWQHLQHIPLTQAFSVQFDRLDDGLIVAHQNGLARYSLESNSSRGSLRKVEDFAFPEETCPFHISQDQTGHLILVDEISRKDFRTTGKARVIDRVSGNQRELLGQGALRFTALSPNGQYAVTGTWLGDGVRVWNPQSGEAIADLDVGGSASIAFSPDGSMLASASTTSVSVWMTNTWEQRLLFASLTVSSSLAFAPDNRILAATAKGAELSLFELEQGRRLTTLATNQDPTYMPWMAFSPDGRFLATCCAGDGIRIWDLTELQASLQQIGLAW